MELKLPNGLKPIGDFTIQVTVGALGFVAILIVAVAVSGVVKLLGSLWWAPAWLSPSADWIEKGLFWFDAGCLALFLAAEAIKLAKGLWKEVVLA